MMLNLFSASKRHLAQNQISYVQHLKFAFWAGGLVLWAGFTSIIHSVNVSGVADGSEFFSGIKFDARYFSEYSDKLPENPKNYQIIYADIQKNPA